MAGLGPARACALAGALELGTRHLAQGLSRGEALTEPGRAGDYLSRRLRALPYEVFACLFLDTRHRVIAFEELFRGTLDGAEVHPREVVQRCLAHHAAAVILGHNHPSGSAEPSAADRAVTRASSRRWPWSRCACSTTSSSATARPARWRAWGRCRSSATAGGPPPAAAYTRAGRQAAAPGAP